MQFDQSQSNVTVDEEVPEKWASARTPMRSGRSNPPSVFPAQGLGRLFGLDPRAVALTLIVDLLLFGGTVLTAGALIVVGLLAAAALGWTVYRIQRHDYGDDHSTALTKAVIVGMLTAIPVPIAPLFAIPGGLVGALSLIRRRK